jgi:hypothetical protein
VAKRYRLRLVEVTREADDQPEAERVLLSLTDDAFGIAGWLLSGAVTITEDDPRAREQLYRLIVTQAERLGRER